MMAPSPRSEAPDSGAAEPEVPQGVTPPTPTEAEQSTGKPRYDAQGRLLVNWDNPKNDPAKRKSIADDPTGKENQKLLG
jgi:hypothetical protein